jgi:hypothetical protein
MENLIKMASPGDKQGIFILWLGTLLLRLCGILALFPALLFFFNIPIAPWFFPTILLISLAWSGYEAAKLFSPPQKAILKGVMIAVCILVASLVISTWLFDLSYDGRFYHFYAIFLLKNGWNPVYNPINPTNNFGSYMFGWVLYYPKASWYSGATLYSFFQHLETAKTPQLLLLFAEFFIVTGNAIHFLQVKRWQAILIGVVISLNPVQIYQLSTNYIDGQISACLTIILTILATSFISLNRLNIVSMCFAIIYAIGLKSTAILYTGIFIGFALIFHLLIIRKKRPIVLLLGLCGLSGILGVFILGYVPYVTNTLLYRNPIYPITISDQEMVMGGNRPSDFNQENRFVRFVKSILASSSNAYLDTPAPKPKLPFSLTKDELLIFENADARTGGFGPWFSGILCLALIGSFWFLRRVKVLGIICLIAVPILLSIFSTAEGWWARYAPQTWLLPVLILIGLFSIRGKKLQSIFSILFSTVFVVNLLLVAYFNFSYNIAISSNAHQVLSNISNRHEAVLLYCGVFCNETQSVLDEYRIKYQIVDNLDKLPCPKTIFGNILVSPYSCQVK